MGRPLLVWIRILAVSIAVAAGSTTGPAVAQSVTDPGRDMARPASSTDKLDQIWAALDIPQALQIMREEGADMSEAIAADYLSTRPGAGWQAAMARIYAPDAMSQTMRRAFGEDLEGADIDPMIAFFDSTLGHRIIALEMSARRTFLDRDAEEDARQKVRRGEIDEHRAAMIRDFMDTNDLVEFNQAGSMNTNVAFYSGLSQSDVFKMTEQEILQTVWNQAETDRADTDEWLRAYLSLAYQPLSDQELAAYISFSETEAGQRLNRALFAGFGEMYRQQYAALGLAVARQLSAEEL
ncbi:DUF2059 domain-containing protein [Pseudooceanicola sp. C21-150M6]|uniref:DUF2059 domain-containing protein n=1 Tax=Pseudooceanicola sp. C21-150M6 TaxID=3434355 RepID=UPI003D7FF84A